MQEGTDEVRRLTSVGIVFNFEELKVRSSNSSQMHSKTWQSLVSHHISIWIKWNLYRDIMMSKHCIYILSWS